MSRQLRCGGDVKYDADMTSKAMRRCDVIADVTFIFLRKRCGCDVNFDVWMQREGRCGCDIHFNVDDWM